MCYITVNCAAISAVVRWSLSFGSCPCWHYPQWPPTLVLPDVLGIIKSSCSSVTTWTHQTARTQSWFTGTTPVGTGYNWSLDRVRNINCIEKKLFNFNALISTLSLQNMTFFFQMFEVQTWIHYDPVTALAHIKWESRQKSWFLFSSRIFDSTQSPLSWRNLLTFTKYYWEPDTLTIEHV